MDKPAPADHPLHPLIANRWSPRAYDAARPVEHAKLLSVLEAARWAPSSMNEQPWSFIVASREDADGFARLLSCLVEGNQKWARNAPVLMIAVAKRHFERGGAPNRHATHDVGLALSNMATQATAMELAVHFMAGFEPAKARQACDIPETHEPITMLALGYAAEPSMLPDDLKQRELAPRVRKSLKDFVFEGKFASTPPWVG